MNAAFKLPPIQQLEMKPVSIFAPRARSCPHKPECESPELCDGYGECKLDRTSVQALPAIDLKELEAALTRNRLDEIATLVRSLTYGEMMELAKAIWNIRPNEVEPLTDETLPGVLHRWAALPAPPSEDK